MTLEQQAIVVLQLLIAALLSGAIGLDRELREHAAGLRTHILVGVGSALFTALSIHAFPDADSSRVASGVVTGIGFLGAGTIVVGGAGKPRNLTTAASIWSVSAIGMAAGAGAILLASAATLIVWVVLDLMLRLEMRLLGDAAADSDQD